MGETFELLEKTEGEPMAVCVRNGCKKYGATPVLVGVDVNVPKGAIYGLLGASGSGKTTLLGCIVGLNRLGSGDVWVSDGPTTIGYMPQQLSLCKEFTVRESMRYFGWMARMSLEMIDERRRFLARFLDLPDVDVAVGSLSGGEQRRVSLAIALLHEPKLLILDEPTVGLDPLLRESIWSHFVELTENGTVTIILTTHYIDEARQASVQIGLLRNGTIIAEEAPAILLSKFNVDTLEQAFYAAIVSKNTSQARRPQLSEAVAKPARHTVLKSHILKALLWKNFLWMRKNFIMVLVIYVLPVLSVFCFCWAIGRSPTGLRIAVVNREIEGGTCGGAFECNATHLSCHFLSYLDGTAMSLVYYDDEGKATATVKSGETYASIVIGRNYTESLKMRIRERRVDDEVVDESTVQVICDHSNKGVTNFLKRCIYGSFYNFIGKYLELCLVDRNAIAPSLKIYDPIYGLSEPSMTDAANPGIIVTLAFFMAAALTSCITLVERLEGTLERTIAMGATTFEIVTAHALCQFGFMLLQSLTPLVVVFCVFDLTLNGSALHVVALIVLSGFCGMCAGLSISSNCDEERSAIYALLGTFLPFVLLTGILWPIEGMHRYLKTIASFLPLTVPVESMRSILQRGWGFDAPSVYNGIVVLCTWTVIFLVISFVGIKLKKR